MLEICYVTNIFRSLQSIDFERKYHERLAEKSYSTETHKTMIHQFWVPWQFLMGTVIFDRKERYGAGTVRLYRLNTFRIISVGLVSLRMVETTKNMAKTW
jgi:hypothetical protein